VAAARLTWEERGEAGANYKRAAERGECEWEDQEIGLKKITTWCNSGD
jgi:hypothetical protein